MYEMMGRSIPYQTQSTTYHLMAENRPGGKEVQGEDAVGATWQLLEHIVTTQEEVCRVQAGQ